MVIFNQQQSVFTIAADLLQLSLHHQTE